MSDSVNPNPAPSSAPAPAPATESAPTDSRSIIESTMEGIDDAGSDDSSDGGDPPADSGAPSPAAPAAPGAPGEPPTTPPPAVQAAIDELAEALGLGQKPANDPGGKWHRRTVPYSKVKQIVEQREKVAREAHERALGEATGKLTEHESRYAQIAQLDRLMSEQPERFMQMLAESNPAYARYMGGQQAPEAPAAPAGRPEPDVRLTDGSVTYSPEQAAALAAWQAEQVVSQRMKPIEDERQARAIHEQAADSVRRQLETAKKWPLFMESKAEIEAVLAANPRMGLQEAYQTAVFPKLAADREKIRAEVLETLKNQPHATSAVTSAPAAPAESGPTSSREIIERIARGLK